MLQFLKSKHSQKGFTLIEILVVVIIIGILMTITFVVINSARKKGRDAKRMAEAGTLVKALKAYEADNGYLPLADIPIEEAMCLNRNVFWNVCCNNQQFLCFNLSWGIVLSSNQMVTFGGSGSWPSDFKQKLVDAGYLKNFPIDPLGEDQYKYQYVYKKQTDNTIWLYYCLEGVSTDNCELRTNFVGFGSFKSGTTQSGAIKLR